MKDSTKYLLYGLLAVLVIGGAWYFMTKGKTGATTSTEPTEAQILAQVGIMKASPEWYTAIKSKAVTNGLTIEEQLRRDAIYSIKNF